MTYPGSPQASPNEGSPHAHASPPLQQPADYPAPLDDKQQPQDGPPVPPQPQPVHDQGALHPSAGSRHPGAQRAAEHARGLHGEESVAGSEQLVVDMDRGQQLALAVALADLVVGAVERGATAADGTPDGRLIAATLLFVEDHPDLDLDLGDAGSDGDAADERRDLLSRPAHVTSARMAAILDWTAAIQRPLGVGQDLPAALAEPTADIGGLSGADELRAGLVAGELLAGAARTAFGRAALDAAAVAAADGDQQEADYWQDLAVAVGQPAPAAVTAYPQTFEPYRRPQVFQRPDRDRLAAALLNASGLSLGYAYLGQVRRTAVSLAITAGLLLIAVATGPSNHANAWFVVAGLWVGATTLDAYLLGRRSPQLTPGSYRRPRLAGVLVLVLVAATFVGYRAEGQRQLSAARDAYGAGDCVTAIDRYHKVRSRFELTLSDLPRTAEAEVRECVSLLAAEAPLRNKEFQSAITKLGAHVGQYPAGRSLDRAQADRATAFFGQAGADADHALRSGTTSANLAYLESALRRYDSVVTQFGRSAESAQVRPALNGLYDRLVQHVSAEGPCSAMPTVTFLSTAKVGSALAFESATELLAQTMYGCGVAQYNAGAFAAAKTQLEALAKQFPDHARTAETRDMIIWATIGDAHATKPPTSETPGRLGRAPGGTAVVYIVNGSTGPLSIMYQGPITGVVSVPACPDCTTRNRYLLPLPGFPEETCGTRQSPVATLRLVPGSYKVLLQDPAGSAGSTYTAVWQLSGGSAYGSCFYQTVGLGFGL